MLHNIINYILVYLGITHYMPFVSHVVSYENNIKKQYHYPDSYKGSVIPNKVFGSIDDFANYYYGNK